MCDPSRSGGRSGSEPAHRPIRLPAKSTETSSPARAHGRKTHSRAAMPASLLGDPADSALGRGTEAGQVDERLVEASPVDQEVGRRGRISDAAPRERRGDPGAIHRPADGSSGGVACPPRRGRKQPERDTSGRKAVELTAHGLPG